MCTRRVAASRCFMLIPSIICFPFALDGDSCTLRPAGETVMGLIPDTHTHTHTHNSVTFTAGLCHHCSWRSYKQQNSSRGFERPSAGLTCDWRRFHQTGDQIVLLTKKADAHSHLAERSRGLIHMDAQNGTDSDLYHIHLDSFLWGFFF